MYSIYEIVDIVLNNISPVNTLALQDVKRFD